MRFASVASAVAVVSSLACATVAMGGTISYSPDASGIDRVCDAYRPHARRANVVRLARVGTSGAAWAVTDEATSARVQSAPTFVAGDFVTIVLDHGAVVSADSAHVEAASGHAIEHAWCFIGGKLSRASVDYASTLDRAIGYRRTRYYGDDLDEPLAEAIGERGAVGKTFVPPPKEIDALLVVEPDARPRDLPFYAAFVLERKHALPHLAGP